MGLREASRLQPEWRWVKARHTELTTGEDCLLINSAALPIPSYRTVRQPYLPVVCGFGSVSLCDDKEVLSLD